MSVKEVFMFNSFKGFTLLELMVTLVIVAVFAAIAIPSYQYFIVKAHKAQAQTEMLKISERLENYRSKQLSYAGYIPDNENIGAKGIVNIPYGSISNAYDYQISLVDINDTTKSLEESALGQGWTLVAVPNQVKNNTLRKSESLLLNSQGLKCKTADVLTKASIDCGINSKDW
jgi:type IV pilus assembly protein PilE